MASPGLCPACGSADLEPAGPPPGGRAVCERCGRCWEAAGRGIEVDTLACPGCPRRGTCEARPTFLTGELTRHHTLLDGTPVLLRPLVPGDRFELAAAYAELSAQARRLRFFAPEAELESRDLEYLTSIDYHDHFAWAAQLERGPWPRGIGVGRYIRDAQDPTAAEVAVTVVEAYQRRGLGTLLTRALADVAAANGIRRFVSYVLWDNDTVISAMRSQGARVAAAEPGVARIELDLPAVGTELEDPFLHHVLRSFADGLREVFDHIQHEAGARA